MIKASTVKTPEMMLCTSTATHGTLLAFTLLMTAGIRRSRPETKSNCIDFIGSDSLRDLKWLMGSIGILRIRRFAEAHEIDFESLTPVDKAGFLCVARSSADLELRATPKGFARGAVTPGLGCRPRSADTWVAVPLDLRRRSYREAASFNGALGS